MEGIMSRISQTGNDVRKVLKRKCWGTQDCTVFIINTVVLELEVDSKRMRKMEKDQSQYRVRQTQVSADRHFPFNIF